MARHSEEEELLLFASHELALRVRRQDGAVNVTLCGTLLLGNSCRTDSL